MNLAKVNLDNVIWNGKSKHTSKDDISITLSNDGKRINIVFRNDVAETITTTGYVEIGIIGPALIFKESDASTGWKITRKNNGAENWRLHISGENLKNGLLDWVKAYGGTYTAKLFREWVYIDGDSKK